MKRTILMLEHDEDDRYITQAFFDENQYNIRIEFVNTGDDLMKSLQFASSNTALPSLILLDYHTMPLGAIEILHKLKSNPSYAYIPVIVLSGTARKEIISECYSAGAASFIQKPSLSAETSAKISNFIKYWFETVELV